MRSKTGQFFVCKVRYEKLSEDGLQKKVTESYIVEALSFTEAEARITEEVLSFISGEFTIEDISKAPFKEIFFTEDCLSGGKWYKAKLQFITIDEATEKEKRSSVIYLVQANTLKGAITNIDDVMSGTMIDYVSCAVQETTFEEVFEYAKD